MTEVSTDGIQKISSKSCPNMSGYILRWIDDNQFIAMITGRFGTRDNMLCHKDGWYFL